MNWHDTCEKYKYAVEGKVSGEWFAGLQYIYKGKAGGALEDRRGCTYWDYAPRVDDRGLYWLTARQANQGPLYVAYLAGTEAEAVKEWRKGLPALVDEFDESHIWIPTAWFHMDEDEQEEWTDKFYRLWDAAGLGRHDDLDNINPKGRPWTYCDPHGMIRTPRSWLYETTGKYVSREVLA